MLHYRAMRELTPSDRDLLIESIASRAGTAQEIALWHEIPIDELRAWVAANRTDIEIRAAELEAAIEDEPTALDIVTPTQLDQLWISNKFARLKRYELVADAMLTSIVRDRLGGSDYATALRELRSYMTAAANELGQLLHRGAGDSGTGDTSSFHIEGVDMESLK